MSLLIYVFICSLPNRIRVCTLSSSLTDLLHEGISEFSDSDCHRIVTSEVPHANLLKILTNLLHPQEPGSADLPAQKGWRKWRFQSSVYPPGCSLWLYCVGPSREQALARSHLYSCGHWSLQPTPPYTPVAPGLSKGSRSGTEASVLWASSSLPWDPCALSSSPGLSSWFQVVSACPCCSLAFVCTGGHLFCIFHHFSSSILYMGQNNRRDCFPGLLASRVALLYSINRFSIPLLYFLF